MALYGIDPLCDGRPNVTRALQCFEETGDSLAQALAGWKLSWCHIELGDVEAALERAERTLFHAREVGFPSAEHYARYFKGLSLAFLGRSEEGLEALDSLAEKANIFLIGISRTSMGLIHWLEGRFDEAAEIVGEVVEVFDFLPVVRGQALIVIAATQQALGRSAEAVEVCQQARALTDASSVTPMHDALLRLTHIQALEAVGDESSALEARRAARVQLDFQAATLSGSERARFFAALPATGRLSAVLSEHSI